MSKQDLLVTGELNVDLILNQIEGFPKIGAEIVAREMTLTLGSSSAIFAANAAAMGISTAFCGMIGDDDYGKLVLRELTAREVDPQFITTSDKHQTGITVVMNYEQDRANVTHCGAMEALTIKDIPWNRLENFRHFHLSNFFLQGGLKNDIVEIFRRAKAAGLTTSLDLQWDTTNQWDFNYQECLPHVDVFFPNESELLALTQTKNLDKGIQKLQPYTNTMAIKLGERGSIGISGDQKIEVPSFSNFPFVDAIGAGDSFNAGFIYQYLRQAPLEDCLRYGNLMGALNTTAAGGTQAFINQEYIADQIQNHFKKEQSEI